MWVYQFSNLQQDTNHHKSEGNWTYNQLRRQVQHDWCWPWRRAVQVNDDENYAQSRDTVLQSPTSSNFPHRCQISLTH